jgi:ABC-type glycerol-3-phosphate transport system substrate-binding protein
MGIDETKTSKMIPAELPVFQEVEHYIGGFLPTFAVMKNSPHREDAIKLLMYWSQPKIAEKWVEYTKTPTGLKGNLSTADLAGDRVEQFQAEIGKKYGGNIHFNDSMGYVFGPHVALVNFLQNPLINLLDGKMTAQEAYEALLKEARLE